jgi:exopolysaccharide biosynthesis polyprenyl glycosylphosphotransferase
MPVAAAGPEAHARESTAVGEPDSHGPRNAAAAMAALSAVREQPAWALATKRLIDGTLALAGLCATAPLMAAAAALVRLESPGSPIFRQERIGLGGRRFTMFKLRTMCADAERAGPQWPSAHDPRVTRIGSMLRPAGIDELPQLWNVLVGDMSLVGPRPEQPTFVERFEREHPGYGTRHAVRPGLTGWAQVNGLRGDVPIGERLRCDLEYIQRWSVTLDLGIILRTVGVVASDALRALRKRQG